MPTGSVSMMTLLLAIIERHAGFAYDDNNVVENLGLSLQQRCTYIAKL